MKRRTKTEEIIRILRTSEVMRVDDICREYGVSAPEYHR
ncbi:DeoR/GlpR family transcriptional regulator of sugar metabolism [Puniceicoccus vermicola]